MAAVEFWACAVAGFATPLPDYEPDKMTFWMPSEQGTMLKKSNGGAHPRVDTRRSTSASSES
jgi:hypothetical protein